ncbi:hypothetical protein B0J14DRAFT_585662 [Halenospora varia]|nr:hypothetical protein B0J14DRAFT_585662 [Halenospora varia]
MYSKPIHPATVHFPIAFITLAGVLDLLYAAATTPATAGYVQSTLKSLEFALPLNLLPTLSYYATIISLVTLTPAILSGIAQLLPLIKRDGFGSSKVKTAVAHAALNDISAGLLAYNWQTRSTVLNYTPSTVNIALSSALAVPMVLYSASLGGSLVYNYGMGIGSSTSRGKKTQ